MDTRGRAERASEWSPARDETFGSAHVDYAQLRAETPFPWSEDFGGFWAATTYADIAAIAQDDNFITSVQNVVPHVPRSSRRPPLHFDPPEHTAYRTAIDPIFRRASLRLHEAEFRESAEELVEGMLARGRADGVADFAAPFVVDCFARLLGVESELAGRIREIGVRYGFAIQDMDDAVIQEASAELYEIARRVYAARLATSPDASVDLVASLHRAAEDPENAITEETAIATVRQMIVAGMGAPQAVLGSIVAHLAQDRSLQDRLRADPSQLPTAVEEFLRLHAPYRVFARTPKEDTVVHGRLVRQGEPVALLFPSGNRDEAQFSEPHEFVLHRKANSHMSFGRGAHKCPAASMGRMELLLALEELLARTESFALAGEITMMNWLEYGPRSVPLDLVRARGAGRA
ncbi:cytochrome P450 [Leucobacter allii]|uniref:cytochrome P450 n=1 Tax=Leucobacter allii TaxID=2932247 RepID=UPI001FD1DE11|nr:cytochrome P450 [Leucobacter allii]UOR01922.1 cytochrome P450 [Leucobacter allii]